MSELPPGVVIRDLEVHDDPRGALSEIFREDWRVGPPAVQWNYVLSLAGSLRGVHVHPRHTDYLTLVAGRMLLGLNDVRRSSARFGQGLVVELRGDRLQTVHIPPGVAHAFYFPEGGVLMNGVSHHWSPDDEIACRWDSPELGLDWSVVDPILSAKDAAAGGYAEMVAGFAAREVAPSAAP